MDRKPFAILYVALMEAGDKWTYVGFAYMVQTILFVERLRRVPGEGAAGSVAPTDGSWQGKDRSRLRSLGYVREQIGGGQSGRGETGRGLPVLKCCAARHPRVAQRTGGRSTRSTNLGHASDLPTSWANSQVLAFVQSWRTLPGIFFQPPSFVVTQLGRFHFPLQISSSWPIFT